MKMIKKLSSKMPIFAAVASLLVVVALVVGLCCQFLGGGFFNQGADHGSYKNIVVNYATVEFNNSKEFEAECEKILSQNGLSTKNAIHADTTEGASIEYRFSMNTTDEKLGKAVDDLNAFIITKSASADILSEANYHVMQTGMSNSNAYKMCAIALAVIVVVHVIYNFIRNRFALGFVALFADLATLLLALSLITIARIPVGTNLIAMVVLAVLASTVASTIYFEKLRTVSKRVEMAEKSVAELSDVAVAESFRFTKIVYGVMVDATFIMFALACIATLNMGIGFACLGGILSMVASMFVTVFLAPSLTAKFKSVGKKNIESTKTNA